MLGIVCEGFQQPTVTDCTCSTSRMTTASSLRLDVDGSKRDRDLLQTTNGFIRKLATLETLMKFQTDGFFVKCQYTNVLQFESAGMTVKVQYDQNP
jgi:hypothetical protein